MANDSSLITHYADVSFAASVEASMRALGKDPARLIYDDLEAIDEFHMGGRAATRAVFDALALPAKAHVLDVGSGIGGPARVAAAERGWQMAGVDLTPQFVDVANDLSRRVGLAALTRFEVGSATQLAYDRATFDGAYMIHVGMNIADKAALMREVRRVLKTYARFMIYDIMRVGDGSLTFPLPWSSVAATSAVAPTSDYRAALVAAGFAVVSERNRTPDLKAFAAATPGGAATPQMLPHRGPGWDTKVANLAALVKAGVLAPVEMVAVARS